MTIRASRLLPAVLLTAGSVALTACGSAGAASSTGPSASSGPSAAASAATSAGQAGSATPGQVTVTVTDAGGCVTSPNTVPAGQVTFVITNVDAVGVTE